MTVTSAMAMTRKSAAEIRDIRAKHPEMRARDFARIHQISEGELVAAYVGQGTTTAIEADVEKLLNGLTGVGEIMALTRNESCVSEKIGPVEKVHVSPHAAMVLGAQIDLRIFPKHWRHGYAVERTNDEGKVFRSLQFFDGQGDAVHKVHARETTDLAKWNALVAELTLAEQSDVLAVEPAPAPEAKGGPIDVADLRTRWQAMTDTHQVFGLLRELKLTRLEALKIIGSDLAWQLDHSAVAQLFNTAAETGVPIMAFVGNSGCTQIHSGLVKTIKPMGPWLNVMDETFHMHLRLDQIADVWAVRKPTEDGNLTSVEVFGADGEVIIHLVGTRERKQPERQEWRALAESLPVLNQARTA